jgi:hypothetical protein
MLLHPSSFFPRIKKLTAMSKDKPREIEEMDWDANARNLKGTIRAHFSFILTLESQPACGSKL